MEALHNKYNTNTLGESQVIDVEVYSLLFLCSRDKER